MDQDWPHIQRALYSRRPVHGLTHAFYNYPARFDPEFVRTVIQELTEPGDVVLDPFMGGGTSIVEAIASGRRAIGTDINSLSHFIATVKTTPLSSGDTGAIGSWIREVVNSDDCHVEDEEGATDRRLVNFPIKTRHLMLGAIESLRRLPLPRQRRFARCALLRWGQWAIETRKRTPNGVEMRARFPDLVDTMLLGLDQLVAAAREQGVAKNKLTARRHLHIGTGSSLVARATSLGMARPKLVITSPPYPGVHVLYHRWQVAGRRETAAPYFLAGLHDGHFASYYTMGSRSPTGLKNYFSRVEDAFARLRDLVDSKAIIVQLVGFSDPSSQYSAYMDAMSSAGYQPVGPSCEHDFRAHARAVPHRKWYTETGGPTRPAGSEYLICHTPKL